jgi:hypothetical protein
VSHADSVTYTPPDKDGEDGTWPLDHKEDRGRGRDDPVMLGRLLRQRHASHAAGCRRIDGVLTDHCATCDTRARPSRR